MFCATVLWVPALGGGAIGNLFFLLRGQSGLGGAPGWPAVGGLGLAHFGLGVGGWAPEVGRKGEMIMEKVPGKTTKRGKVEPYDIVHMTLSWRAVRISLIHSICAAIVEFCDSWRCSSLSLVDSQGIGQAEKVGSEGGYV